jgi:hypothetical protein
MQSRRKTVMVGCDRPRKMRFPLRVSAAGNPINRINLWTYPAVRTRNEMRPRQTTLPKYSDQQQDLCVEGRSGPPVRRVLDEAGDDRRSRFESTDRAPVVGSHDYSNKERCDARVKCKSNDDGNPDRTNQLK